jgi:hypothetical protein
VLTTRRGVGFKSEEKDFYEEESILLLTKQIKCLEMNENMEGKNLSEY